MNQRILRSSANFLDPLRSLSRIAVRLTMRRKTALPIVSRTGTSGGAKSRIKRTAESVEPSPPINQRWKDRARRSGVASSRGSVAKVSRPTKPTPSRFVGGVCGASGGRDDGVTYGS
ncbi:Hypothetical protein NTJ_02205 [Nesidiocoris tenuis]|uniref:Uncharacterized protein n=1 Tax=Nesidiocoris tenuis TaxID=355587 RepID=A0ABN7AAS0_9HEMI|nr:Hypothetical protein NTJ_02205 [Nesidiocoris tenuis]